MRAQKLARIEHARESTRTSLSLSTIATVPLISAGAVGPGHLLDQLVEVDVGVVGDEIAPVAANHRKKP